MYLKLSDLSDFFFFFLNLSEKKKKTEILTLKILVSNIACIIANIHHAIQSPFVLYLNSKIDFSPDNISF